MILVTGASGHLGQWVVGELTAQGCDVIALARRPLERPNIRGVTWCREVRALPVDLASVEDLASLRPALADVRAVVHLAAHIPSDTARNSDADADATLRCNALATARLLALLGSEAPKLEALVYASTFEVYGVAQALPIDEQHPTEPSNYYGASKLAGEDYVRLFASDRAVPSAALRLPAIYGPGDTLIRAVGNFARAAAAGRPIEIYGDGADLRELVHVADAARAVARSIDARASGAFNIGSGRGISIREMADAARRATGSHADIVFRDRVKPRVDYVLAIERARRELGWMPRVPLDDGVRGFVEWIRASAPPPSEGP